MNRRLALASAVALTAAVASLPAFIRSTVTGDDRTPFLFQPNPAALRFLVQDTAAPDLRNADGRPFISPTSDPLAALEAALETWSEAPLSTIDFQPLGVTSAGRDPFDGVNVFVFEDDAMARTLTLGALGTTVLTVESTGAITDADVLFNPNFRPGNNQVPYSTDLALNTIDIQGTATHALGLALGAGPSPVIGSALFPFADLSTPFRRNLSSDDLAFAAQAYPGPGSEASLADITGVVMADDEPATGVLVTAVDPDQGIVISALTDLDDGTYRIRVPAAPQARYLIYAEALDGPVVPQDIKSLNLSKYRTDVRPRFFGSALRPSTAILVPGREFRADLNLETGTTALTINAVGVDVPGGSGTPLRLTDGPIRITSGEARDLLLVGVGVDSSVGIGDIRVLAPGVVVREGSVRVDPLLTLRGAPVVRATLDVAPRDRLDTGSILVVKARAMDAFTGALLIEPARPTVSGEGITNAASFLAEGVAPGMIASFFGAALGPEEGISAPGFDPLTARLPQELGGIRVNFDGIEAPLFFVSFNQLNVQAPFELAGRDSTTIIVSAGGVQSEPVTIPVVSAQPGLFSVGPQAIVLNQDGSLNGPENPARKGEFVTLYLTGSGTVDPPVPSGAPAPVSPLSRVADVTVEWAGVTGAAEDLFFAGLTPGFVGLTQINVRIPLDAPSGDQVGLVVRIAGQASQAGVGIAIE